MELDEMKKEELNEHLQFIKEQLLQKPQISITYFLPDTQKNGGAYLTITGTVRKIEQTRHQVIMENGTVIPMDDIYEIESALFDNDEY